jgi:hypothetical protein
MGQSKRAWEKYWERYEAEVQKLEEQGLTRSDAQGVVDIKFGYPPAGDTR